MEKGKRRKTKLITELKKNECLAEGKKKTPHSDYHNKNVTNCQPVAPQPMNTWAGWAPHKVKAIQAELWQRDRNEM